MDVVSHWLLQIRKQHGNNPRIAFPQHKKPILVMAKNIAPMDDQKKKTAEIHIGTQKGARTPMVTSNVTYLNVLL